MTVVVATTEVRDGGDDDDPENQARFPTDAGSLLRWKA